MESKTFSPVTPLQFETIRTLISAKGFELPPGNSGQIKNEKFGIALSFSYNGTDALTLQILTKPMLIPSSLIWREMEKAFETHVVKMP